MAAHGFKRGARRIGRDLVVAAGDPDFAAMLDADLRRTEDMPRGMEADFDSVDRVFLAVRDAMYRRIGPDAMPQHADTRSRAKILAHPRARVIAVRVRDDGTTDRPPGIDVEITCFAIESPLGDGQQVGHLEIEFEQELAEEAEQRSTVLTEGKEESEVWERQRQF